MIRTVRLGAILRSAPRRADPPQAFAAVFSSRRHRLRGSISPTAVDALALAIQNQEGYYPGSISYQNNNPGNLVYAGQPGASPGAGGFAKFSTYDAGLTAEKNQITLDATRGTDINGNPTTTVSELLTSWAPPSQNDTASYISSVSSQTGYDPNAPLSSLDAPDFTGTITATASPSDSPALDLGSMAGSLTSSGLTIGQNTIPWWMVGAGAFGLLLVARN